MTKAIVSVSLDAKLVELAKQRGLKLSSLFNEFLKNYLENKELASDSTISDRIQQKNKQLEIAKLLGEIKGIYGAMNRTRKDNMQRYRSLIIEACRLTGLQASKLIDLVFSKDNAP